MVTFYKPEKKALKPVSVKVEVTDLDLQGRGVAHDGDKVFFIPDLMPGDIAQISYEPSKSRTVSAKIQKILTPSKDRIKPDCSYLGSCGGCPLQYVPENMLLSKKTDGIRRLFNKALGFDLGEPAFTHQGSSTAYRRACRFAVRGDHGRLHLGFREEKSHSLVKIDCCCTLTERINSILPSVKKLINSLKVKQKIGHVEFLDSDGALGMLIRITQTLDPEDEALIREFGDTHKMVVSVVEPYKDPMAITKTLTTRERIVCGSKDMLYVNSLGVKICCKPSSFVQINTQINDKMLSSVIDMIKPKEGMKVMDLFCGLGNFAMPIAKAGASVTGVDIVFKMIEDARANAKSLNLLNARFEVADLSELFENQNWAKEQYDAVVMDPGRDGAKRATLFLAKKKVPKIVLISCNPLAASRDSVELLNSGYKISKWGVMDMFPRTGHIEMILEFDLKV